MGTCTSSARDCAYAGVYYVVNKTGNVRIKETIRSFHVMLPTMQSACALLHCSPRSFWLYDIFAHCTIFGKKLLNKTYVLIFSTFSEIFDIPRRLQRNIIINIHRSPRTLPVILVTFWSNVNFLDRFSKNTQIPNLIKIHPVEAELFHVDGRTDMTKPRAAFRYCVSAPKNEISVSTNKGNHVGVRMSLARFDCSGMEEQNGSILTCTKHQ